VIAGHDEQGLQPWLAERASPVGLAERVHFPGFVTGALKLSLFQAADVYVMPSHHESFGYALIEAMFCGTPGVATPGVKNWPELESSGGALITEPTPDAVAGELRTLLDDDGRRARMGAAARAWCAEALDRDHVLGQYEALYEDAAG
jgi:glycosyltransferase involved in cell wall biosynthesis